MKLLFSITMALTLKRRKLSFSVLLSLKYFMVEKARNVALKVKNVVDSFLTIFFFSFTVFWIAAGLLYSTNTSNTISHLTYAPLYLSLNHDLYSLESAQMILR